MISCIPPPFCRMHGASVIRVCECVYFFLFLQFCDKPGAAAVLQSLGFELRVREWEQ